MIYIFVNILGISWDDVYNHFFENLNILDDIPLDPFAGIWTLGSAASSWRSLAKVASPCARSVPRLIPRNLQRSDSIVSSTVG